MILANGKLYPSSEQSKILDDLETRLNRTLCGEPLQLADTVSALDRMSRRILSGEFDTLVTAPALRAGMRQAGQMLSRDAIEQKLRTELPETLPGAVLRTRLMPLGVLLHIAAGNMDALPAWSVIEGLLAGNINLLKLPQADSGLTIRFLQELIAEEPKLLDHIYVFDTPSTDVSSMQRLVSCADGIAVWGGDAAVTALRRMAPPGCRLIEWGHRLGFCYLSGEPPQEVLSALAGHIVTTNQLLCSSCQVIYLDTDSMEEVRRFADRFLPLLDQAAQEAPVNDIYSAAAFTMRRYTAELEQAMQQDNHPDRYTVYGQETSVTVCTDSALELSPMYGNVLVKRLPAGRMLPELRKAKGYLQTAGLWCKPEQRDRLTELLLRSGVNRVLPPGQMSETFIGEAHDGEYALRRYSRAVNLL